MTRTLLIDLDNTLLSNEMDTFLPAYIQALAKHLAPYADGERLIQSLLKATGQMAANQRPDCTLIEIFASQFYPALGLTETDLAGPIESFYNEVFPTLKRFTQPIPEASQLVEEGFRRGYRIVIATNPLFPRTAILQRLEWAGLPLEDYPFDLVCSYETFHFAKPNPAFLAECLARLGWPEGPAVVIGDHPKNDIAAAAELGLPAYWVRPNRPAESDAPGRSQAATSGSLDGFFTWLDAAHPGALEPDFSQTSALLAILRSTPAALNHLCHDLPAEAWIRRPEEDEWSLTEILCHLRDVDEEVNLPRLQQVLREHNPFLPGMVTDPWAEERMYICQSGLQALGHFTGLRLKLLDLIGHLPAESWERKGRHAIFGPTSFRELVSIIANHDRLHIQQAAKSTIN